MVALPRIEPQSPSYDLVYLLRRAEQESIAEIRAMNALVADRHGALARAYSNRARAILSR